METEALSSSQVRLKRLDTSLILAYVPSAAAAAAASSSSSSSSCFPLFLLCCKPTPLIHLTCLTFPYHCRSSTFRELEVKSPFCGRKNVGKTPFWHLLFEHSFPNKAF